MARSKLAVVLFAIAAVLCVSSAQIGADQAKPSPPRRGPAVQWFFGGSADVDTTDDLGRVVVMESSSRVVTYEVFRSGFFFRGRRSAAIVTTALGGQPLAWLERLGAEFSVDSGDVCGRRAPRFTIRLDVNLDDEPDTEVVAHLGSADPQGACEDGWNTFDNLVTDEMARFEMPGQGWYLNSWADVVTHLGQARIHSIWFEVDDAPVNASRAVKVISLTVNSHRFTASKAIKYYGELEPE